VTRSREQKAAFEKMARASGWQPTHQIEFTDDAGGVLVQLMEPNSAAESNIIRYAYTAEEWCGHGLNSELSTETYTEFVFHPKHGWMRRVAIKDVREAPRAD